MQLHQFACNKDFQIKYTPIYIINYSEYYLKELCDNYPVLEQIAGGWDDVPYRQGTHEFRGHMVSIWDYDKIGEIADGAVLLILDSYPNERFGWLREKEGFLEHFSKVYYFGGMEMKIDLAYREKYKDMPLKDIIVFRSGAGASRYVPGSDFGDNSKALFEYMLANNYDKKYELVWLVKEPKDYEGRYIS